MLHVLAATLLATVVSGQVCHLYSPTIESPCYDVVQKAPEYEIRLYVAKKPQFWSNANIPDNSFAEAQNKGFHANFHYIEGENNEKVTIPMTAPVISRKNETGQGWQVSFYTPSKYSNIEAVPVPTNPTITIDEADKVTWAVFVFNGFAEEADYVNAQNKLLGYLKRDSVTPVTESEWSTVWAVSNSSSSSSSSGSSGSSSSGNGGGGMLLERLL